VIEQNDISLPELEQFKQLDTQFAIDLNLLPLEMITARRNKLTEGTPTHYSAIDQIIDIESTLHLRVLKKNSVKKVSPTESPSREQQGLTSQNEGQDNMKTNQRCERRNVRDARQRNGYMPAKHNQDALDDEEVDAIKD
jgi:hypothetical protein